MKSAYLAGPITGCNYDQCTEWRQWFVEEIPQIECYDPMRAKLFLADEPEIEGSYDNFLATAQSIVARDMFDCHRCDVLLVNLLGATMVSIGTVFEIAWAYRAQKPIVLVMEKTGNIHEHPFLDICHGFRVDNLEDAVTAVKAILL